MSSPSRVSSLIAVLSASPLAAAHPGHGAASTHLHGEFIFIAVLVGAVSVGTLLQFVARRAAGGGVRRARL